MPSLERIQGAFGGGVTTSGGRVLRGALSEPPKALNGYLADFLPRHILTVDAGEIVTPTTLLTDAAGTRFLCMAWNGSAFGRTLVSRSYVLFEVNRDAEWHRTVTTVEPISGLASPEALPAQLGVIPMATDTTKLAQGNLQVPTQTYTAITSAKVLAGDILDGQRVRQVREVKGLRIVELQ